MSVKIELTNDQYLKLLRFMKLANVSQKRALEHYVNKTSDDEVTRNYLRDDLKRRKAYADECSELLLYIAKNKEWT